mgnify:CR=1 FL=1
MAEELEKCPYGEPCFMRTRGGECEILTDTKFDDGKCHFRKETPDGPNAYDEARLFGDFIRQGELEELINKRRRIYAELRELEEDIREAAK